MTSATLDATMPEATTAGDDLDAARAQFAGGRGYLAACTMGLAPRASAAAMRADLARAERGAACPVEYGAVAERTRSHYARLVGVDASRVAIGSQTSVLASLIAAGVPDGGEVLLPENEFSSLTMPFVHAGRGIRVRCVPLAALADEIGAQTSLVAFSLVQSATGEIADLAAITTQAAHHGARTLCDTTQAVGWLPVDATTCDATICHTYKWLCAPRGVAFLTVNESTAETLRPIHTGWYAGIDPWSSCYGADIMSATDARRFDVSPSWQAFVGAEPALELFAGLDPSAVHAHATALASAFRERLGLTASDSAIVTWADAAGDDLARLGRAGVVASGRAGRARVAFHVFNDDADVDDAARALGR